MLRCAMRPPPPPPALALAFSLSFTMALAACGTGGGSDGDSSDATFDTSAATDSAVAVDTPGDAFAKDGGIADTNEAPIDPPDPDADPPDPGDASPPPPPTAKPGCTASATLGGVPAWFFFTRPDDPCTGTAGSGTDSHALDELTRLIASVPAGGRIDGHIYSITVDGVAKALLDAQRRGVAVWLSTDKGVGTSTDSAKTTHLDKLTHKTYCSATNNSACIGTADGAISHTKLFVFSEATAPDGKIGKNVVWLGSANQTYASGMKLFNNTVTIYGDATLYTKLFDYLGDLYAQRRSGNYYDPTSGRGHLLATAADVYVSPELDSDLVVNRLDDVTIDSSCEVRVLQASVRDSRTAVVDRLVKMKKGGCNVIVASDNVEPSALAALKAAGIPVHQKPIHDKTFIIHAKFVGVEQFRVYTGSHNLSISANTKYDEIFVKLAPETATSHPVYDAYLRHFDDAYAGGKPL
jgi:hypothetical protein